VVVLSRAPVAALALVAAGCFSPTYPDGVLRCGPMGECPPGQGCDSDGICRRWRADFAGSDLADAAAPMPPGPDLAMPDLVPGPDMALPCGNRCDPAQCVHARCLWSTPVSSPGRLFVDASRIYVSSSNGSTSSVLVFDHDLNPQPPAVTGVTAMGDATIDAANVYWATDGTCGKDNGAIYAAPKGNPAAAMTLASPVECPTALSSNGTTLFWIQAGTGTVHSMPVGGGPIQDIQTGLQTAFGLTSDASAVYWAGLATFDPSTGVVRRHVLGAGSDSTWSSLHDPGSLTIDAANVYWAEDLVGPPASFRILQAPLGGGATTSLWDSTQAAATAITSDGTRLYFPLNDGTLRSEPVGGGPITTLWQMPGFIPVQSAVDANYVYLVTGGMNGALYKAEK
jgi:hypothetical protein